MFGGTLALAFVSVGFMLPGLVRTKFASLIFGASGIAFVGQLSQIQTVLISLGAAGVVTASRVILARKNMESDQLAAAQNWFLLLPTLLAVAFAALVIAFSPQVAVLVLGSERFTPLVIAAAAGIPPAVYGQISLAIAQVRSGRPRLVVAAMLSAAVGSVSVAGLLLLHDEFWASTSFFVAPLAQAIVISSICFESRFSFGYFPRLPRANLHEVISLSWSSALLGIFAATAELAGRTVVVQRYGLESLAAYQPVVLLVTQFVGLFLSALATSSLIEIAKLRDHVMLASKLNELVIKLLPVIGGLLAILSGCAQVFIFIFYSPSLVDIAFPLVTLALAGEIARAYAWTLGSCLLPQGLTRPWLMNGLVTVAVQLAVSGLSGYLFGPLGLVTGLVAANAFAALFTFYLVVRAGIIVRSRGLLLVLIIMLFLAFAPSATSGPINFVSVGGGVLLLAYSKFGPRIMVFLRRPGR
ncbi:hypothetical protein [Pseudarthrobacter enclensis]|uniref:O-antigen/teichoic acid export membrane protein n=1 Tax=Pseudarthrobacter enclensis TaxID=993070 RepID=A0ABT9RX46_9MICC|nr:hypothetical protein [Pseudarthrobacter enclensis]MDP9889819.1 O-antigen/teichoic acid export membrane protein [Pseudarthrobacter enclensis]